MSMRYTGPNADYPVYCCRSDRDQQGSVLCQEVRALAVDALVERVVLDALVPDQIEIALAAAGQLEQESRQLERQWALRVERARYEAERARRQYDAVEPENRLVARSLERVWEEKLRIVEAVEQQHARWRAQEPLLIGPAERAALQALGENLPRIWNAATTSAADRKRIRLHLMDQRMLQLNGLPAGLPAVDELASQLSNFLNGYFSGEVWYTRDLEEYIDVSFIQEDPMMIEDALSGEMARTNAFFDELYVKEVSLDVGDESL
ncbi:hypothetical protein [Bradyrhizobium sp. 138]|uniref:hypothetical protein n=1 Tax=Bradyrhizobium sp. 138 TaxID=2782615 RepID=UPI001FF994F4|nr:hypothetical protein [Bradyrhizobium sp. 138]